MKLQDATGTVLTFATPPARIVSLVPSLTETVFSLGAGERIAGVTRFCEEPAAGLREMPRVGGTKDPNVAQIMSLRPDLVVASSEENRLEDVQALRDAGATVLVTHYETVEAAVRGIEVLSRLLGAVREPEWLAATRSLSAGDGVALNRPVSYFCPIWRRPYMVARDDTYMSDLLRISGGINAVPARGDLHYLAVELADVQRSDAEVILLPDEPYPFDRRHRRDFEGLTQVAAVRNRRIHFVDGKALTWYGPRTAAAIALFRAIFDEARMGHELEPGSAAPTASP